MRSGAIPVTLTDLCLLRTGVAGTSGVTLSRLIKDLTSITGGLEAFDSKAGAGGLPLVITDWQVSAVADGLLHLDEDAKSPILCATSDGVLRLTEIFGESLLRKNWKTICERHLIARALGMPASAGVHRLKRLETAAGLRLAVVRKGWSLRVPEGATPGQIRNALAAHALADAFGKSVQKQIGADARFSAKAGRTIAAQLLDKKRRVASDSQLITALAAQCLDIQRCDLRSMRNALIRRLIGTPEKEKSRVDPATLDAGETASSQPPDGAAFLRAVRSSAKLNANGWSGNRKAYISHVWRSLHDSRPDWQLSEAMFKSMLAEAHRDGQIVLMNADLRDKNNMRDIQDSAVHYKNMEWHFIQVAD